MTQRNLRSGGIAAAIIVFACACGGGDPGAVEVPGEDTAPDTSTDIVWNWDTAPGDVEVTTPDAIGDAAAELAEDLLGDLLPGDLPPETWTPVPCGSHSDCGDGLCIEHPPGSGSSICAPLCVDGCPPDWDCHAVHIDGPDPLSVCLPPIDMLCAPCAEATDCIFVGSLCITEGEAEGYCGRGCSEDGDDCPDGFSCQIVTDLAGDPIAWQCRPEPGSCCAGGEWVDCDDDNACTLDACVPGSGCIHEPQDVPCEGPAACTNYQCVNGECVGWAETEDLTWDGVDDDCDGMTDEDVVFGLSVDAWTYGSGISVSEGGGLRLRGQINTPGFHGVSAGGTLVLTSDLP